MRYGILPASMVRPLRIAVLLPPHLALLELEVE